MRRAVPQDRKPVERFVLQGCFARTPYYELRLETTDDLDVDQLAQNLDRSLAELNVEYQSKRKSGRLGPIKPRQLTEGTLVDAEARKIQTRNGRIEQYKHQYLLTEVLQAD
ncbi:MAG: hypothetical protein ACYSTL_03840 [Planctomycetota bacterium]